MSRGSFLSRVEPEAIPFPFSRIYTVLAGTTLFRRFYSTVAGQVDERLKVGRILDIGTGPGRLPIMIAARNPMLLVTGLDLSRDMVKIASESAVRKGLKNVEFRQGSADTIPFSDREFDLAISTLSFHHWKEPEQALDEIYRVLREGGEAWIYDVPRHLSPTAFAIMKQRYGFFRAWAFRLHAFTEPFYMESEVNTMAAESRFKKHELRHTEMTYRLILYK
ncbi:MAG TPA: class I SAM-dependent methyltransferase [Methanocella sp.]|nr:class I SAM-dependent methyltransferase [Methanocella sp.]